MPNPAKHPMKVLIIPDKFKGTLSSLQAAKAIASGWKKARPTDTIRILPLTDGGDGFGDCLRTLLQARQRSCQTINAAHQPCRSPWWISPDHQTVVIESARCIGLAMLPPNKYHPFQLDTQGLAKLLLSATRHKPKTCLVGIGGSATNDGGFGLATGLGWQFLSANRQPITQWPDLIHLRHIIPPPSPPLPKTTQIIIATDVQNPLLGRLGATRIYGPQKGIRPQDIQPANQALQQLSRILSKYSGQNFAPNPGAGAAGGLGFGLLAFANASIQPGTDIYSHYANLPQHLDWADLVITGEGRIDASSLMGKGVGEIARQTQKRNLPCIAIAGSILQPKTLQNHFTAIYPLTPNIAPLQQALQNPKPCLHSAANLAATAYRGRTRATLCK